MCQQNLRRSLGLSPSAVTTGQQSKLPPCNNGAQVCDPMTTPLHLEPTMLNDTIHKPRTLIFVPLRNISRSSKLTLEIFDSYALDSKKVMDMGSLSKSIYYNFEESTEKAQFTSYAHDSKKVMDMGGLWKSGFYYSEDME
ncbi:hypothetical protein TorRG33x02_127030 [Trema orientale]|uniref:Uncharacterized protein n=1 Tax=Trema orientale TaxID=63057 RepID=A0A2P5F0W4_TREOI|nr:hypothetical protein TorRG33x02_127030 [Trema orientale]